MREERKITMKSQERKLIVRNNERERIRRREREGEGEKEKEWGKVKESGRAERGNN